MSSFSLNISYYTIIQGQGDINLIDRRQTTTNVDSFNVTTTTHAGQSSGSAPESPLESSRDSDTPFDDVSSLSASASNTTTSPGHQQSGGISNTGESETRSTVSTSESESSSMMSVKLDDDIVYPPGPSRAFTQIPNSQQARAAHHNSIRSTFKAAPEPLTSANRTRKSPAQRKKLCRCLFSKLKGWFNKFLTRNNHS